MEGRKVIPVHVERAADARVKALAPQLLPLLNDLFPLMQRRISGRQNVEVADIVALSYECIQPLLDIIGPASTCRAGCSHCCHIPVKITEYEALLIASKTGRKPQRVSAKAAKRKAHPAFHQPCPFLADGRCSIYEVRPLMCRIHYSFDDSPEWCDFSAGVRHTVAYWDRRPVELIWSNIELSISASLHGKPRAAWRQDIRQWFPVIPAER